MSPRPPFILGEMAKIISAPRECLCVGGHWRFWTIGAVRRRGPLTIAMREERPQSVTPRSRRDPSRRRYHWVAGWLPRADEQACAAQVLGGQFEPGPDGRSRHQAETDPQHDVATLQRLFQPFLGWVF